MKKRSVKNFQNFIFGFCFIFVLGFFLIPTEKAEAGIADHMVINEVYADSVVGTSGSYDDWIELYNPSDVSIDVTGWSIQKQSSASTSNIYKNELSGVVPPQGFLLLVRNNTETSQTLKDMADILVGSTFSISDDNVFYLVNDNVNVTAKDDLNIVDFVGIGSAENFEGSSAALNPAETKSIARFPDGEDSDDNSVDFIVVDSPEPKNSESGGDVDSPLSGTVLLTVIDEGQENIAANSADITFQVNDNSKALVYYGLDDSYGSSTAIYDVVLNTVSTISIVNLECNTEYHYSIYVENITATETDNTIDAVFTTLPCGIVVDSLTMTKASAKSNNNYIDGWQWEFDLTIWNLSETSLKMKFNQWNGADSIDSGTNIQFSVDSGVTWLDITENGIYSFLGADISDIDLSGDAGRQVNVIVRMKLPIGTQVGNYNSSYGILTE